MSIEEWYEVNNFIVNNTGFTMTDILNFTPEDRDIYLYMNIRDLKKKLETP